MLEKMRDKHIETLMRVAKTNKGLRPFFGTAQGMIRLRMEAYSRGIYPTHGDRADADRLVDKVCSHMEKRRDEVQT